MRRVPEDLRAELKIPAGEIRQEGYDGFEFLITVGDESTYRALKEGVQPRLAIYDYKIKRDPVTEEVKKALEDFNGEAVVVENEAGTITEEAEKAVKEAIEGNTRKIFVKGEEDLLVIPCILYAPIGATVIYGQPDEGMVIVKINEETKMRAKNHFDRMEVVL